MGHGEYASAMGLEERKRRTRAPTVPTQVRSHSSSGRSGTAGGGPDVVYAVIYALIIVSGPDLSPVENADADAEQGTHQEETGWLLLHRPCLVTAYRIGSATSSR